MTVNLAAAFRAMDDWAEREERRLIRRILDRGPMFVPEPHTHGPACTCLNCAARRAFIEHRRDREPLALTPPRGVPIYADETIGPGRFVLRHHGPMTDEQRRDAVEALRRRIVEPTYGA